MSRMKTVKIPSAIAGSEDLLSSILDALPEHLKEIAPNAIKFIAEAAEIQNTEIKLTELCTQRNTAILRALNSASLHSPRQLLALDTFLAELFPVDEIIYNLADKDGDEIERRLAVLLAPNSDPEPVQAELPEKFPGIGRVVDIFKEKALSDFEKYRSQLSESQGISESSGDAVRDFIQISRSLAAYASLFKWEYDIHISLNVFARCGASNLAANMLGEAMRNLNSSYLKRANFENLAEDICRENLQASMAHEMASAEPACAQEALSILRKGRMKP